MGSSYAYQGDTVTMRVHKGWGPGAMLKRWFAEYGEERAEARYHMNFPRDPVVTTTEHLVTPIGGYQGATVLGDGFDTRSDGDGNILVRKWSVNKNGMQRSEEVNLGRIRLNAVVDALRGQREQRLSAWATDYSRSDLDVQMTSSAIPANCYHRLMRVWEFYHRHRNLLTMSAQSHERLKKAIESRHTFLAQRICDQCAEEMLSLGIGRPYDATNLDETGQRMKEAHFHALFMSFSDPSRTDEVRGEEVRTLADLMAERQPDQPYCTCTPYVRDESGDSPRERESEEATRTSFFDDEEY